MVKRTSIHMIATCVILILIVGVQATPRTRITFEGLSKEKQTLSVQELRLLGKRDVSVMMVGYHQGYIGPSIYTGVPLKKAMIAAGYEGTRGADVSCEDYIRVIGEDGYGAILSWGEVFNQIYGMDIILAYEKNGNPLDSEEGPIRLILPGDYYCGRYVKGVTNVEALTGYELPPEA